MSPEAVGAALAHEARAARRVTWSLRAVSLAFAGAYVFTIVGLRRLDPFYLLLTLGTLLAGASQFVFIERYRVPGPVQALAGRPDDAALLAAVQAHWPAIRARWGRELAALGPQLASAEEVEALTLSSALDYVAQARRRDWVAVSRRWASAMALALPGIALACLLHTPSVD